MTVALLFPTKLWGAEMFKACFHSKTVKADVNMHETNSDNLVTFQEMSTQSEKLIPVGQQHGGGHDVFHISFHIAKHGQLDLKATLYLACVWSK